MSAQNRDFTWTTDSGTANDAITQVSALATSFVAEARIVDRSDGHYFARWRHYGLGPVDLNFIEVAPQQVYRTREMASRSASANYDLVFIRSGHGQLRHCQRESAVPAGSMVLLDNEHPYDVVYPQSSVCLTAHLDDSWLRRWIPEPKACRAQTITGNRSWASPLAALLMAIADQGPDVAAASRNDLADHLGAMLSWAFGDSVVMSQREISLSGRILAVMEERFFDPALNPERVAMSVGISKRHLHTVLAKANTSFSASLCEIRLARAAHMLKARRSVRFRVGDVAAACGFQDPSYFARLFRRRYGTRPLSFCSPE